MLELVVNNPFSMLIVGPSNSVPTDSTVYVDGVAGMIPTVTPVAGTDNRWKLTFTPTVTGTYSIYAFSTLQLTMQCVNKSLYSFLENVEDEAMGSWTWDKQTGVMTMLRQNGTTMATFDVKDTLTDAYRERT